ncbi:MAG TPA: hypothetical protein VHX90_03000 [Verrucomicrobiae bacterium]|jgi:hypothetical protein|nr:hypothetical protein [Verrucomicrobiae bacterium]
MKNKFVADGFRRFLHGKKAMTSESIEKKYAKELAVASPAQKAQIREQMAQDFLRQQNHKPSPGTLW